MHFRKSGNTTSVGFEPRTSFVRLQRIKHCEILSQPWLRFEARTSFVGLKRIDRPRWNQVNFNHQHKNQVKFDAHTKTKRFAAGIKKPSQFRPPTPKPSQSITTLKTSQFRPAHSQFRSPARKTSRFRSQRWNQVIFDPPHKNQVLISTPPLQSSQFDSHSKPS